MPFFNEHSLKFQALNLFLFIFSFFQMVYYDAIYSRSFRRQLKFIILFLPRKIIRTNFQIFKSKSHTKIKRQMIQICVIKKKEKEESEGKPNSVTNGGF